MLYRIKTASNLVRTNLITHFLVFPLFTFFFYIMPKNSLYSLYIVLWLLIQILNNKIAFFKLIKRNIIRKFSLKGIAGYNGNMYFFGGSLRNKTVNDMLILDTTHLNWEFGSQVNAPTPRVWYGATLLPIQHII